MTNKLKKRIRDLRAKTGMSRQAATNILGSNIQCLCGHARHEHNGGGCTWCGIPTKPMIGLPQPFIDLMRANGAPARCPCAGFRPLPAGATMHFGPDDETARKLLDALIVPSTSACPFCAMAPVDLAKLSDEEAKKIAAGVEPSDWCGLHTALYGAAS